MAEDANREREPAADELRKERYRFLVTYYLHQDKLSWSRTQAVIAVEAGIVAAAFSKKGTIAVLALLLGSMVIGVIWLLIERDWHVRDQHMSLIDEFHEGTGIRMVAPAKIPLLRGTVVSRLLLGFLLAVNIIAAICFGICACVESQGT